MISGRGEKPSTPRPKKSLIHTNKYLRDPVERERQIYITVLSSTLIELDYTPKQAKQLAKAIEDA